MREVELKLVANNNAAVQSVKQLATESQKLYDNNEKAQKKQVGLIADIEKELSRLQSAQKNAINTDAITKYNQKIAEAKQNLQDYNEMGVKTEKTGNSMLSSIGKWALGFASVSAALKIAKDVIASTESTTHAFEVVVAEATAGVSYFFKAIASGDWKNFREGMTASMNSARQFTNDMEDIQNRENEQRIKSADISKQIADLRSGTFDKGIENNDLLITNLTKIIDLEKKDYLVQAAIAKDTYDSAIKNAAFQNGIDKDKLDNLMSEYTKNKEIIDLGEKYNVLQVRLNAARSVSNNMSRVNEIKQEISLLGDGAEAAGVLAMEYGKVPLPLRKSLSELKAQQITLEGQAKIGSRRDENQLAMAENKKKADEAKTNKDIADEAAKIKKKEAEAKLKIEEDYQKAVNALIDRYNKANIDSLTGVAKLKAQRDLALEELGTIKTHLTNIAPLTDNQQSMLEQIWSDIWKQYTDAMVKEAKVTPEQKDALSKALSEGMPKLADLKLAPSPAQIGKGTKPLESIWELFGIDPESIDGKKEIEAINKVANTTMQMLDSTFKNKVDDAKRNRELLDTKISEAQSALQTETELYKAGSASNVDAKKKEVADLKIQRDIALKNEEEAVKRQRTLETITQLVNMITSSTEIFKSFSKIPVIGIPLAIAMIATMFGAFASAKSKANAMTQLAEGGTGVVTGRSHSQGGERFLDHVEVEDGERWGVLSRKASRKYGPVFNQMVNSFNRDALPIPRDRELINNVIVQNEGPNKRLDQLILLNKRQSREEIIELGNQTIIRKGNSTKTIRR